MPTGSRARALVLAALLLGVVAWIVLPRDESNFYDVNWALVWGHDLLHGAKPSYGAFGASTPHPLVVLLATVGGLLGHDAAREFVWLTGSLAWAATLVAVFAIGQAVFSTAAGVLAAVLLAVDPELWQVLATGGADGLAVAVIAAAVAMEVRRPGRGLPTLGLLAVAGLLRPEAWGLAALYWLWWCWGRSRRRALEGLALVAAGPALWLLADLAATGDALWSLHHTSHHIRAGSPHGAGEIVPQVRAAARDLLDIGTALAIASGIVLVLARRTAAGIAPVLAAIAAAVAGFVALGLTDSGPLLARYLALPIVLAFVFAGHGLTGWANTAGRVRAVALLCAALAVVPLAITAPRHGRDVRHVLRVERSLEHESNDLRATLRDRRTRRAFAACPFVVSAGFLSKPQIVYDGGLAPTRVGVNAVPPDSRGLVVIVPATRRAADDYQVPVADFRATLDRAYRQVSGRGHWAAYAGACAA